MMLRSMKSCGFGLVIFVSACLSSAVAQAGGTPISYQGTLDIAGAPASGLYDFRVALFDSIELGSQIPGSLAPVYEDVSVEAGLVNLAIDFGVGVFNGEPRFIQFEVREAKSTGNYTILQPRQQVFPSPEALNSVALDGDIFQRGRACKLFCVTASVLSTGIH